MENAGISGLLKTPYEYTFDGEHKQLSDTEYSGTLRYTIKGEYEGQIDYNEGGAQENATTEESTPGGEEEGGKTTEETTQTEEETEGEEETPSEE